MSDENSYTEVTTTSYGERIGNSFKGIIFGIILFLAGTGLLYWNEGRAVRTGDAINEAQLATENLPSIEKIDPSYNGKMVHATGRATTKDVLTDPVTNISVTAIGLIRNVTFYQWVENSSTKTTKNLDGSEEKVTTYTYEKKWTSRPISSANFKKAEQHKNSLITNLETQTWTADNVSFGAYALPKFLINSIGGAEIFTPDIDTVALQERIFPDYESDDGDDDTIVHVQQNILYLGEEPHDPDIGDIRITYSQKPQADISILARVNNNTFDQFLASNGTTFYQLNMGVIGADIMYQSAKDANSTLTWILRGVGIVMVVIGLNLLIAPFTVIASIIPLLGDLIGAGAWLAASLFGIAWSCIIIAIAWIRFRPLLGISLLILAVILIALLYVKGRSKRKAA